MQFSRTRAQPWAGSIENDSPPFIRLEDPALDIGYGYRPALALPYLGRDHERFPHLSSLLAWDADYGAVGDLRGLVLDQLLDPIHDG
jgi:hypothetical protein